MVIVAALLLAAAVWAWPGRGERAWLRVAVLRAADSTGGPAGAEHLPWWRREVRLPRRAASGREEAVQQLLSGLAAGLGAGLAAPAALSAAVASLPAAARRDAALVRALGALEAAVSAGGSAGGAWIDLGQQLRIPVALQVGRAWTISERLGSPLSDAVRSALDAQTARLAVERAFAAQAAGPRATAQLLTWLPLLGVLLMPVLGVAPSAAYPPAVLLLAVAPGLLLLLAGRRLTRRLVDRALRPPPLG
ncbi:hypothetical protein GCM10025872_02290 [Barrientosiimonas endolithica]|uniref:Type II secretion system protein GspF domain-containing protein n=1 Tax=Barrientosiimonas endolithica TaxID=1535208 RepID=A0ABN6YGL5_9MICO|nr:hypothetical protein GCM10025872_02290 [Barrientosiimonas endolithica]